MSFFDSLPKVNKLFVMRQALLEKNEKVFAQMAFFLWIGALLFAFYTYFPPETPFATGDAVFPRFIAEELPMGLGGLVIAAADVTPGRLRIRSR